MIKLNFSIYAAFTLNGFDDQERNLIFGKTDFKHLELKFRTCNFKQAFYPYDNIYRVILTTQNYF